MQQREKNRLTRYYLKPYTGSIIIYFVLMCMATAFSLASILSISNFLQILFGSQLQQNSNPSVLEAVLNEIYLYFIRFGKSNALWIFAAIIFGVYFFKDLFTYLSSFVAVSTRNKIIRNIRRDLFSIYTAQSIEYVSRYKKGDLLTRISADVLEYDKNVLLGLQTLVSVAINVLLYFAALLCLNPVLTLVTLVVVPLVGGVVSFVSKKLKGSSARMQKQSAELISRIEETISGLRIIKSHTAIELMNNRFNNFNNSYTRLRTKIYRRIDLASPQSEFFGNCMVIGILLLGTSYIVSVPPKMSADIFIVYLIIFTLIIKPAKDFSTSLYNIKKGQASEQRISEILSSEPEVESNEQSFEPMEKVSRIELRHVGFAYNETKVLDDVNLVFKKGEPTAIVGPSGAGKSTLTDLLMKIITPCAGEIYYNDRPLSCIGAKQIRQHISVVSQDTFLFNDTVENNLTFFDKSYTSEQIKHAAEVAKADEFISKLERGYQTIVGEGGSSLSGGQKQRLSIARAVLRDTEVLLLDEATSALDTVSEKHVQQAIDALGNDKIIIAVAHRLSTIKHFPHIVVLNQGKIAEQGNHQSLMAQNGLYARLCSMQQLTH